MKSYEWTSHAHLDIILVYLLTYILGSCSYRKWQTLRILILNDISEDKGRFKN